jgi:hypothetical protein
VGNARAKRAGLASFFAMPQESTDFAEFLKAKKAAGL